jgi:hypothetical protein
VNLTELAGRSCTQLRLLFLPATDSAVPVISTLGWYLRNAGKVGWVGIRLASVCCMTQQHITVTVSVPDVQKSTAIVS